MTHLLLAGLGALVSFILGARMAWPKDKARIIRALEQGLASFWRVEFFIEDILDRTDDPEIQAEGKRALEAVLAVKRAWRQIRAEEFEQGLLFRRKDD